MGRGINLETRVVFHREKIRELIDKINEIFLK